VLQAGVLGFCLEEVCYVDKQGVSFWAVGLKGKDSGRKLQQFLHVLNFTATYEKFYERWRYNHYFCKTSSQCDVPLKNSLPSAVVKQRRRVIAIIDSGRKVSQSHTC
jgi:hypothetical protein